MSQARHGKCYCTAPLRADGTCRYGCPPELKPSVQRRRRTVAKEKAQAARVHDEDVRLTPDEEKRARAALKKRDPLYGRMRTAPWKSGQEKQGRRH